MYQLITHNCNPSLDNIRFMVVELLQFYNIGYNQILRLNGPKNIRPKHTDSRLHLPPKNKSPIIFPQNAYEVELKCGPTRLKK